MQWIYTLSVEQLGITQYTPQGEVLPSIEIESTWRFTRPDGKGLQLQYDPNQVSWVVSCDREIDQDVALRIVEQAASEARAGNAGGRICYHTELVTSDLNFTVQFGAQFLRALGDHVVIEGWRRLSDRAWLEFSLLEPPVGTTPLIPRTKVSVYIWAPGLKRGPLSDRIANSALESTRLICALALGMPLDTPTAIFPAKGEELGRAQEIAGNESIPTLARRSVSLDIFGQLPYIGGAEAVRKVRTSLVSFDAAIRQDNTDVATILHVSGMEALAVPDAPWRKERVATRFQRAVRTLCPQTLDTLLAHENAVPLFQFNAKGGLNKRRQRFLDRIYELRSTPVHSGPSVAPAFMGAIAQPGAGRLAFLSELHWNMILGYLLTPMSFLVGHPKISPGNAGPEITG